MNVAQVKELDEAVDALLAKLAEAKRRFDELPSADEVGEVAEAAGRITASLELAAQAYSADDFPMADDLQELASEAGNLAAGLRSSLSVSRRAEIGDKLTANGAKVGDKLTVDPRYVGDKLTAR